MSVTSSFVKSLGIPKQKKVSEKANELLRLLDVKCPLGLPKSIQSFGTVCSKTVCIELACRLNSITFEKKDDAVRATGVTMPEYQQVLITIQNILCLKFPLSLQELCVVFGCPGMKGTVEKLLEQYQEKFVKALLADSKVKRHVDFSNPEFRAAAFYLCAVSCKLKVDKAKLIQHSNCNPIQFNVVCESIQKYCNVDTLHTAPEIKEFKEKKRKREEELVEKTTPPDDEISKTLEAFKVNNKNNRSETKENIPDVKKVSTSNVKSKDEITLETAKPPRKKLKQMNLDFFANFVTKVINKTLFAMFNCLINTWSFLWEAKRMNERERIDENETEYDEDYPQDHSLMENSGQNNNHDLDQDLQSILQNIELMEGGDEAQMADLIREQERMLANIEAQRNNNPTPLPANGDYIREAQDYAYMESLRRDQEKERQAQQEKQEKERQVQEEKKRQEEQIQKEKRRVQQRENKARSLAMLGEPDLEKDDKSSITKILFRMPDGRTRVTRHFYLEDTVETLFDFIDVNNEINVEEFDLVQQYPLVKLSFEDDLKKTLREAGFTSGGTTLLVREKV
ncbi:hypothetical protein AKO1_008649 [Acrasis kona]|uniref:UBX domain-containing protein n=1 Tax=Acrasis kona TaxID=1008807 RepID=A0AAW2ZFZ2_9EUKA